MEKKRMSVKITSVEKGSPFYKKRIRPGCALVSINGNPVNDVLDYRFYSDEDRLKIEYVNCRGKTKRCTVKTGGGETGAGFETYLMDKHRSCRNRCMFCFIDQNPPGMRESIYFKDDDSRLSFLFGNYITLTNLSDEEASRIIKMHISPLNVSVHTMNPSLRVEMMKNPSAGEKLSLLERFSEAGISINAQLVLCPGVNDGAELVHSLEKLGELKSISSIAAVPAGLTKYRENLPLISKYTPEGAKAVIDTVDRFNENRVKKGLARCAFASDEFYQLAGVPLPCYEYYEDFPQLDNGVGMLTLLTHDFREILAEESADEKERSVFVATGAAAAGTVRLLASEFTEKFSASKITVYEIKNRFFGENVTVAGLITGNDLVSQLKEQGFRGKTLAIPAVMLKGEDEPVFLDDISVGEAEAALNTKIIICKSDAASLFGAFMQNSV